MNIDVEIKHANKILTQADIEILQLALKEVEKYITNKVIKKNHLCAKQNCKFHYRIMHRMQLLHGMQLMHRMQCKLSP